MTPLSSASSYFFSSLPADYSAVGQVSDRGNLFWKSYVNKFVWDARSTIKYVLVLSVPFYNNRDLPAVKYGLKLFTQLDEIKTSVDDILRNKLKDDVCYAKERANMGRID